LRVLGPSSRPGPYRGQLSRVSPISSWIRPGGDGRIQDEAQGVSVK
jgi:hypothetical protein